MDFRLEAGASEAPFASILRWEAVAGERVSETGSAADLASRGSKALKLFITTPAQETGSGRNGHGDPMVGNPARLHEKNPT